MSVEIWTRSVMISEHLNLAVHVDVKRTLDLTCWIEAIFCF